eukprot:GILK01003643.1.p1 GENE.GILK01003643.1~~GILK01003643.1.p1  ORF type:complete len:402 (+),score=58.34 GILK01003643.1:48-1208(+)
MAAVANASVYGLMGAMLLFGTFSTLILKYQDTLLATDSRGENTKFEHPVVQTAAMFLGESLCLFGYWVSGRSRSHESNRIPLLRDTAAVAGLPAKRTDFSKAIFLIPTVFDCLASTLSFVGLLMTYTSVYQMLRGAIVVFTGLFSIMFLGRRLLAHHWLGLSLIVAGVAVVGLNSLIYTSTGSEAPSNPMLGIVLVLAAQVFAAGLMVVEEKYFANYQIHPLQAVGYEGAWGVLLAAIILPALMFVHGSNGRPLDDVVDAVIQIQSSWRLLLAVLAGIGAIALYNFCGVSVTKRASATARSTIDTTRTVFVWAFCILAGWEDFHWLQVGGFVLLVLGTMLYNEIIRLPQGQRLKDNGQPSKQFYVTLSDDSQPTIVPLNPESACVN